MLIPLQKGKDWLQRKRIEIYVSCHLFSEITSIQSEIPDIFCCFTILFENVSSSRIFECEDTVNENVSKQASKWFSKV